MTPPPECPPVCPHCGAKHWKDAIYFCEGGFNGDYFHRTIQCYERELSTLKSRLAAAEGRQDARWIPLTERRPASGDFDSAGRVLWLNEDGEVEFSQGSAKGDTHWLAIPKIAALGGVS